MFARESHSSGFSLTMRAFHSGAKARISSGLRGCGELMFATSGLKTPLFHSRAVTAALEALRHPKSEVPPASEAAPFPQDQVFCAAVTETRTSRTFLHDYLRTNFSGETTCLPARPRFRRRRSCRPGRLCTLHRPTPERQTGPRSLPAWRAAAAGSCGLLRPALHRCIRRVA